MDDSQALIILDRCVAAVALNRDSRVQAEQALRHVATRLQPAAEQPADQPQQEEAK